MRTMALFPSFPVFLQVLINGVLLGSMYGVAAIGLSLIFGSMQIIFVAQGTVMILGAYGVYWMTKLAGMDPLFGFLIITPLFLGFGWGLYETFFKRVEKAGKNPSLLLAFGLMVLMEHLMSLVWTPNTRTVTVSYSTLALAVGGISLSFTRLVVAAVALIASCLLYLFLKKTMVGKAVLGVAEDKRAASLLGISPGRISAVTFGTGIALAGVAGVSTSLVYPFDPYFGFLFSLKALIAVAYGGLGSVLGALLGGVILGVLESLGAYVISAGWAEAITYGVFLLVLVLRPHGLLGRSVEKA